ncbi:UNVERIFIED_CONTAM: hypothetical protein FKN15_029477 [Acipenser sinensis]
MENGRFAAPLTPPAARRRHCGLKYNTALYQCIQHNYRTAYRRERRRREEEGEREGGDIAG